MAKGEWKGTTEFIEKALSILKDEHPMTVRQLFYRLVSAGVIENTKDRYQYVSRMMTKARRDDRCPYEWLVDRSRPTYLSNGVSRTLRNMRKSSSGHTEKTTGRCSRRDWRIWCEKDAVIGSIEDTTNLLGVTLQESPVASCQRRDRTTSHSISSGWKKPITVFYLGDHDPSGRSIEATAGIAVSKRMFCITEDITAPDFDRACRSIHYKPAMPGRIRDAATRHPQVGYQDVQPTAIESQGHRFSNRRLREEARRSLCRTRRSPANGVTESYRRRSQ